MSTDNGILINLKTFKVTYYMGDGEITAYKCKTLEEAVKKAKELDDEYGGTEYGVKFIGSLKKSPADEIMSALKTFDELNIKSNK